MEIVFQMFICSYVNSCNSCSHIDIGTAVNVTTVDWSGCTDIRQYNMTVTNSDSVVLYTNSTSCCSGNLTIHCNIGNGMTSQTLNMTKKSPSNTVTATGVYSRAQNTTQTDQLKKNTSKAFSNTLIAAIIILSCVSAIIFFVLVFSSRRRTPRFDFTACHLR
uniref:Uncharacterized protein n=2 Tax=Magallana gigas TaxID=29159 RepID=A0A8W8MSJ3_MAGGI|nr:uncharacterized protein LOC117686653 [Crassostrea gigas]